MSKTRISMDIDGVLNVDPPNGALPPHWPEESWRINQIACLPSRGFAVRVTYSTAAMDALRTIEALPGVDVWWCTTWEEYAHAEFAPVVGIGGGWMYVEKGSQPVDVDWWKAAAVRGALDEGYRVVWLDDEIGDWVRDADPDETAWLGDLNALAICPSPWTGILPEHIGAIKRFVATGEKPQP